MTEGRRKKEEHFALFHHCTIYHRGKRGYPAMKTMEEGRRKEGGNIYI